VLEALNQRECCGMNGVRRSRKYLKYGQWAVDTAEGPGVSHGQTKRKAAPSYNKKLVLLPVVYETHHFNYIEIKVTDKRLSASFPNHSDVSHILYSSSNKTLSRATLCAFWSSRAIFDVQKEINLFQDLLKVILTYYLLIYVFIYLNELDA
jgi:hypothetical protein